MNVTRDQTVVWKQSPTCWVAVTVALVIAGGIFFDSLRLVVGGWESEEYSHGYIIPFITLFLVWQQKDRLEQMKFKGSWLGVGIVFLGLVLFVLGELATIYAVTQYAFVVTLLGMALALMGWQPFLLVAVPIAILFFTIPLPAFLYNNLSQQLQLLSSEIGAWFIRLFGISVFLDGNVIDLGAMKLQVVEACNGLRYLFPLMTLGFIAAYFYKVAFWKRALVFLSTAPITVLMNSFRIGMIGVTVEYWGKEMAEGFLHDFEGWAVFMASLAVLLLEMWLLTWIGRDRRPLREVFGLEFPDSTPKNVETRRRTLPLPFQVGFVLLLSVLIAGFLLPERQELMPDRQSLAGFPLKFDEWQGREGKLDQIYEDALRLDDYIVADFSTPEAAASVNFYVAYYASQRKGRSAHSPRACLPGGGWEIKSLTQETIDGVRVNGVPLQVNRTVIRKGDYGQLVYYWFQQRGRVLTNEYLVKWYLFWDALTRNRTDGALVRLTTIIQPGEDVAAADRRLRAFSTAVGDVLEQYVPN